MHEYALSKPEVSCDKGLPSVLLLRSIIYVYERKPTGYKEEETRPPIRFGSLLALGAECEWILPRQFWRQAIRTLRFCGRRRRATAFGHPVAVSNDRPYDDQELDTPNLRKLVCSENVTELSEIP